MAAAQSLFEQVRNLADTDPPNKTHKSNVFTLEITTTPDLRHSHSVVLHHNLATHLTKPDGINSTHPPLNNNSRLPADGCVLKFVSVNYERSQQATVGIVLTGRVGGIPLGTTATGNQPTGLGGNNIGSTSNCLEDHVRQAISNLIPVPDAATAHHQHIPTRNKFVITIRKVPMTNELYYSMLEMGRGAYTIQTGPPDNTPIPRRTILELRQGVLEIGGIKQGPSIRTFLESSSGGEAHFFNPMDEYCPGEVQGYPRRTPFQGSPLQFRDKMLGGVFDTFPDMETWNNGVDNDVARLKVSELFERINQGTAASQLSCGVTDSIYLALGIAGEMRKNGGPNAHRWNTTYTTRTVRNNRKWEAAAADHLISPSFTNPPSSPHILNDPQYVGPLLAPESDMVDSITRWNHLITDDPTGVFLGQPPFAYNAVDYARGLHLACQAVASKLEQYHAQGIHHFLSSIERCHDGFVHPHIMFELILRKVRNAATGQYEVSPTLIEENNYWMWYYGAMPQCHGQYTSLTSLNFSGHILMASLNGTWTTNDVFRGLMYMQKCQHRHYDSETPDNQRRFHHITEFPCSVGGFACISICNPKRDAESFLLNQRYKKVIERHQGKAYNQYHFIPQLPGGNYERATSVDFPPRQVSNEDLYRRFLERRVEQADVLVDHLEGLGLANVVEDLFANPDGDNEMSDAENS